MSSIRLVRVIRVMATRWRLRGQGRYIRLIRHVAIRLEPPLVAVVLHVLDAHVRRVAHMKACTAGDGRRREPVRHPQ